MRCPALESSRDAAPHDSEEPVATLAAHSYGKVEGHLELVNWKPGEL